jgi:hypothetical protein
MDGGIEGQANLQLLLINGRVTNSQTGHAHER